MVHKDSDMGGSLVGGNFLDTLGSIAGIASKVVPFML
jgi:hypothetical protein